MKILAINPGSTSTKIAVFDDCQELFTKVLRHDSEVLMQFERIIDQYDFRKQIIIDGLKQENIEIKDLDSIVGRGGLLKPIPGGVYRVNDALIADIHKEILGEHASNLGAILARELAQVAGKPDQAFIVDPVVVDELDELARYSGHPTLPRVSIFHALNQKAVARRYARENNKKYQDVNLIVVHLGGGITVGAHKKGLVVDVNNGLDGDGPFSPERTGSLPIGSIVKLCFSRKFEYHEIKKMITGRGGFVSYLGTNNAYDVEVNMEKGDEKSKLVFDAMIYQVAKEIGACSAVLKGKVDAILLTGGLAHSDYACQQIKERIGFIAPIQVYPGEDEMQALVEGVFYALNGDHKPVKEYK